jgi:hypothetical protein
MYSAYNSLPATISVGLVIVIISIFLQEMPERHLTLGAVIAAISIAQLASSITVVILEEGAFPGSNVIILFLPLAGSIISLLGGLAAILWKP